MDKIEGVWTTASTVGKSEVLTKEVLDKLFEKVGVPQGLVLLPDVKGYVVYQFPVTVLKGAITLMQGKLNPFDYPQHTKFTTDKTGNKHL